MKSERYSIEKTTEGGKYTQKEALEIAKAEGAKRAVRDYSPYVGQYGILVEARDKVHERLEDIYYGSRTPRLYGGK